MKMGHPIFKQAIYIILYNINYQKWDMEQPLKGKLQFQPKFRLIFHAHSRLKLELSFWILSRILLADSVCWCNSLDRLMQRRSISLLMQNNGGELPTHRLYFGDAEIHGFIDCQSCPGFFHGHLDVDRVIVFLPHWIWWVSGITP